jgi:hypothetical protein
MNKRTCGQCSCWEPVYYEEGICEVMPRAPGGVVLLVLADRAACPDFLALTPQSDIKPNIT